MRLRISNKIKLTPKDIIWIYNATKEALSQIRQIDRKTSDKIDGEVFTAVRRASRDYASETSPAIRHIFTGKKKDLVWRVGVCCCSEDQERLGRMYAHLKGKRLLKEPDAIAEIEIMLLGMKANLVTADKLVVASENVSQKADSIQNILDGEEQENGR